MSVNKVLIGASICSAIAALIHISCIVLGGDGYRFLGAGEPLALMAEQGHWYPAVITLFISSVLFVFSVFAASGAGIIRKLPFLKLGLIIISLIYLSRAVGFAFIMPMFPENSLTFWWVTSSICNFSITRGKTQKV